MKKKTKWNITKVNLLVDIALVVMYLVDYDPSLTGLAIHEWLGVILTISFVVHILLHWDWVVQVTRRILGKVALQARINYILNIALFIAMTLVMASGIIISREFLAFFGLQGSGSRYWTSLHHASASWTLWLVAFHIALHWKWVVSATKRFIWPNFLTKNGRVTPNVVTTSGD